MIKSYCKINLFLKVLKKLKKTGLHNIQSNTALLALHDEITIELSTKKEDEVKFYGKFSRHVPKNKNTVVDTMKILRDQKLISDFKRYKITINKKIPVFAGLGGGTSNSVFLTKYFLDNKIKKSLLPIFEEKIGSDFRLFFYKNSYQESLQNIKEFKKKYKFYFILVYPYIKCSTKSIYSKVTHFKSPLKKGLSKISTLEKYIQFLKNESNNLQGIVEKKFKKTIKILELISSLKNCHFSRVTGSGSVCYGIFTSKSAAMSGQKMVQKKFRNYWCVVTKTI